MKEIITRVALVLSLSICGCASTGVAYWLWGVGRATDSLFMKGFIAAAAPLSLFMAATYLVVALVIALEWSISDEAEEE